MYDDSLGLLVETLILLLDRRADRCGVVAFEPAIAVVEF
jgi:hypothetical protein